MSEFIIDLFGFSPLTLLLFCATAFFAFLISSILGIGAALILMPVLMTQMPAPVAIALAAPTMLASNAVKTYAFRHSLDLRAFLLSSSTALPFALGAAFFTNQIDGTWLRGGLALVILSALIAPRLLARRQALKKNSDDIHGDNVDIQSGPPPFALAAPKRVASNRAARILVAWGVVIGTVSGLSGAPGPLVAISFRGYGLLNERFVGTIGVFAVAMQAVKLPAYIVTNALPRSVWPLGVLLSTAALLAVPIGKAILKRIDPSRFRVLLDVLLAAIALWLLCGIWMHRA